MKPEINTVYTWRGGGYDGCVWEPNMGFVDEDGKWNPVISTGCGAIDDLAALEEVLDEDPDDWRGHKIVAHRIDLEDPDCLWLVQYRIRTDYVAVLFDALREHGYAVQMRCTKCGKNFEPEYDDYVTHVRLMQESGFYTGDGGIGVITDDVWCEDCMEKTRCSECGMFGSDPNASFRSRFFHDWLGICDDCAYYIVTASDGEDRLEDLEEQLDRLRSDFRKYAYAMKRKGHPDLRGCLKRAKEDTRRIARNMVDGVRDWFAASIRSNDRLKRFSHLVEDAS